MSITMTEGREATTGRTEAGTRDRHRLPFVPLLVLAALLAGLRILRLDPALTELARGDNDDILRFLSVRDWRAGQGWFDMVQPRMVPPEGLDLHWSRLVDAGIAGVARLVGLEGAIFAWPALLLAVLVIWTGLAGRRLFDARAGLIAVLMVWLWPALAGLYFAPARLDHHNVQVLLASGMTGMLIWPGRAVLTGAVAGALGAASLAVGLEQLPAVALAGLVLTGAVLVGATGARARLCAFALILPVAGAALFAAQVPPAGWAAMHCDELAPPILSVMAAAVPVALAAACAPARWPLALRAALVAGLAAGAIALLWPLLGPCAEGPYGSLPDPARRVIAERITEARPALALLAEGSHDELTVVLPALTTVLLATATVVRRAIRGTAGRAEAWRVSVLLAFGWLGLVASLSQVRLIVMAAPVVPWLAGYAVAALLAPGPDGRRGARASLAAVAAMAATLFAPVLAPPLHAAVTGTDRAAPGGIGASTCRSRESLAPLAALPRGTIFAPANLSAPILLLTDHAVLTGPYHRSPAAMADGVLPFDAGEDGFRAALDRLAPDYLVLCRRDPDRPGDSFADGLAAGASTPDLVPVPDMPEALVVLRVE
ncbi:hypothetical protein ATO8_21001 [Roseivivax marinus]|uniref:Glycosyltransferase RgtA/B/C/D-like domain-containing protein n=1 Tax=Roseivivax marinus TaxID=1379903 RepID=W4HFA2_9RHOB|nr:hypothetical protein [Roseivivax marinus]ETW10675.1 hypothetical protein ATO8_21001 [Roseivivax marinus]